MATKKGGMAAFEKSGYNKKWTNQEPMVKKDLLKI